MHLYYILTVCGKDGRGGELLELEIFLLLSECDSSDVTRPISGHQGAALLSFSSLCLQFLSV